MPDRQLAAETGVVLLVTLDMALPRRPLTAEAATSRVAGIAAAISLNALFIRNGLGWNDVVRSSNRLAKLCGALGSDFEAERAAAYDHAVRLIMRSASTWSLLVQLPVMLQNTSPSHDRLHPKITAPVRMPKPIPHPFQSPSLSPPEHDWITTVHRLQERRAWRSQEEHIFLAALEASLIEGHAPADEVARRIRNIWWWAELKESASKGHAVACDRLFGTIEP